MRFCILTVCRLVPGQVGEREHFQNSYVESLQQAQKTTSNVYERTVVRGLHCVKVSESKQTSKGSLKRACSRRKRGMLGQ